MKWVKAVVVVITVILATLACAFLGLRYLLLGRLTLPTVKEYEKIAKTGLPLAQAITDYRIDNGLLPEKLDDLIPKYFPAKPTNGWTLNGDHIVGRAGLPHTYVNYAFYGSASNEWWIRGEAKNVQLHVPGIVFSRIGPTGEQLVTTRLAEYERRIAKDVTEKEKYADKINYVALKNREELLRTECERAAKLFPDWWFPRMALATLNKSSTNEHAHFAKWVDEHPSFVHFCLLARYSRDHSDTVAAVQALRRAADYPFEAYPSNINWVGAAFAFDAAKFAYEQRQFDLTLKICESWRSLGVSYGEKSWFAFMAATELSLGQFDAAIQHAREAVQANAQQAMWAAHLPELLRAAELKNTNYVYRAGDACTDWRLYSDPRP